MSLQPADKKPSKALEEDLTVASDHALEPFQGEDDDKAEINLEDYTNWLFYFNGYNQIVYRRTSSHGVVTTGLLKINGSPIAGNPTALAAADYQGLRLYYFDSYNFLSEAILPNNSDKWKHGELNRFEWKGFPHSGLTATTKYLPQGVYIRVRFHGVERPSEWTFADYVGGNNWVRRAL